MIETRGPAPASARGASWTWTLAGGLTAGLLACAALVFAREASLKYVVVTFASLAIVALMPLVGNVRLFCLYAIITLSPLGLRLSFLPMPHMGGAGALYLEAVDPFVVLLFYFQLRDRIRGYRDTFRFPPALAFFAGMMVLGIACMAFEQLRKIAILELVRMLKVLVLVLVVVNELVRRGQFRHAVAALMLGVILQAGIALAQNLRGAQIGLQFLGEASDEDVELLGSTSLESGEFVFRAGGLLGHANFLAAYFALFLPVAVALLLTSCPRVLKALCLLALLLGPPALVLTLSRAGWIDFSVALVVTLSLGTLHAASRRRFLFSRVAIIVGLVAAVLAASPLILKRLNEADPNSVKYRLEWARTARDMIEDNPVFGVGLNGYVYRQVPYGRFKTPAEMRNFYGEIWPVVHNSWLIVWSEQGTLGMLLWIGFHLSVVGVCIGNLKLRDPMMHALGVGLFAGFIAIMIDGLASFFVRQEATSRMFWIATGMILALGYWRRQNEAELPAPVPPRPAREPAPSPPQGRWLPARPSPLR